MEQKVAAYKVGERVNVRFIDIPEALMEGGSDGIVVRSGRVRGCNLRFPGSPVEDFVYVVLLDNPFVNNLQWQLKENQLKKL